MRIQIPVAIVSALMSLSIIGCGIFDQGGKSITNERPDYNERIRKTSRDQVFDNIVRVYNDDVPQFMDVTSINAQLSFTGALTAAAMLPPMAQGGGSVAVTQGGTSSGQTVTTKTLSYYPGHDYSLGGTATWAESPTITYQPLQGQALVSQIATPLTVDTLVNLYDSNWPLGAVLTMAADRLTPARFDFDTAVNAIIDLDHLNMIGLAAKSSAGGGNGSNASTGNSSADKNDTLVIYFHPEGPRLQPANLFESATHDDTLLKAAIDQEHSDRDAGGFLWNLLLQIYGTVTNDVTVLTITGSPEGTFVLWFITPDGRAHITDPISCKASTTDILTAIENADTNLTDITVTEDPKTKRTWTIKWPLPLAPTVNIQVFLKSGNPKDFSIRIPGADSTSIELSMSAVSKTMKANPIQFQANTTTTNPGNVDVKVTVSIDPQSGKTDGAKGNSSPGPLLRTRSALGVLRAFVEVPGIVLVLSPDEYHKFVEPEIPFVNPKDPYYFFDMRLLDSYRGYLEWIDAHESPVSHGKMQSADSSKIDNSNTFQDYVNSGWDSFLTRENPNLGVYKKMFTGKYMDSAGKYIDPECMQFFKCLEKRYRGATEYLEPPKESDCKDVTALDPDLAESKELQAYPYLARQFQIDQQRLLLSKYGLLKGLPENVAVEPSQDLVYERIALKKRLYQIRLAGSRHYLIIVKGDHPPRNGDTMQDWLTAKPPYVSYTYPGDDEHYCIERGDLVSQKNFTLVAQLLTMQAVAPPSNNSPGQTVNVGAR